LRLSPVIIITGFSGLLIAGIIRKFVQDFPGIDLFIWIFSVTTIVGFIIFLPAELLLTKPSPPPATANIPASSLPLHWRIIFGIAYGQLPGFIYKPVLAIAYLLGACVLLIMALTLAVITWKLIQTFFPLP